MSKLVANRSLGRGLLAVVLPAALVMLTLSGCSGERTKGEPSLPAVAEPDIAGLEAAQQTQIKAVRDKLADPKNVAANGELGMLYHAYGLPDAAAVMYRRAALLEPASYRWPFLLGDCLNRAGKKDESIAAFRESVRIKPEFAPGWLSAAMIMMEKGQFTPAREAMEKARDLAPDSPLLLLRLGEALLKDGKPEQAMDPLRTAAGLVQGAGVIHRALAEVYEKLDQPDRAARERVLACSPSWGMPGLPCPELEELDVLGVGSQFEMRRAESAMARGQFDLAIDFSDKAIASAPKSIRPRLQKAQFLFAGGRTDDGWSVLRKAVEELPDDPLSYCGLAETLLGFQKMEEVPGLCEKALALDPNLVEAHIVLAEYLSSTGDPAGGEAHLRKVLERAPTYIDARARLGKNLFRQGKKEEARAELEQVLAQDPTHGWSHFALANLDLERGAIDSAVVHLESAIEATPTAADPYLVLSQIRLRQGQYGLGDALIQRGLSRIPGNPGLVNAQAWLRATCPDALYRNGKEALMTSQDLCQRTKEKDPTFVDTLAAAYAEVGDFKAAAKAQQAALDLFKAAGQKAPLDMDQRLQLYQSGKPYRDVGEPDSMRKPGAATRPAPDSGAGSRPAQGP